MRSVGPNQQVDHSRPQQTPPCSRMRALKEWSASLLHPDRRAFPNCSSRRNSRCHLPRDLCSNRLLYLAALPSHAVPSEPTFCIVSRNSGGHSPVALRQPFVCLCQHFQNLKDSWGLWKSLCPAPKHQGPYQVGWGGLFQAVLRGFRARGGRS